MSRAFSRRPADLTPSPIQAELIPEALDGKDVIGQAKTGTGKTAAFGIPIIEMMEPRRQAVPCVPSSWPPTQELVQQIVVELTKPGCLKARTSRSVVIYGGEPIERQLLPSNAASTSWSAPPGRVLDHIERRTLYLGEIFHVVLDEADRMLTTNRLRAWTSNASCMYSARSRTRPLLAPVGDDQHRDPQAAPNVTHVPAG